MKKQIITTILFLLLILVASSPGDVFARDEPDSRTIPISAPDVPGKTLPSTEEQSTPDLTGQPVDDEGIEDEWSETEGCCEKPSYVTEALVGYRAFSSRNVIARAAQYEDVHSGIFLGAGFSGLSKDLKLTVDGMFLSDTDYHGDVLADYKGVYRFHFRTEDFYHNLDHLSLAPSFPRGGISYNITDSNPADIYGLSVETNLVSLRYKMPTYPFHINLGVWQLKREGLRQQIYSDQLFNTTVDNYVYSKSRRVDNRINEFSCSIDGHMGYFDAIYGFTYRQFDDAVRTPRDSFTDRSSSGPAYNVINNTNPMEHNAVPDSIYYAHSVQLHTSLTGSLVSAISYTYAKRENRGTLSDTLMQSRPEDTINSTAFNLNYTPDQHLTFAVRYRFVDVEKDNPASVNNSFFTTPNILVRPSIDFYRNSLTASAIYRPLSSINIKAEYSGEFVNRSHTDYWLSLPEESDIHKGTLTVNAKPIKGLRLKLQYSYATANNPSYGTSFGERHEGQFNAVYTSLKRWGGTFNYRIAADKNDQITRSVVDSVVSYNLPRSRETITANANLWVAPLERLTISAGYGLLWGTIEQMVLFQSKTPGSQDNTNYDGNCQVYTLNATYQATDLLALSVVLQHLRSAASFEPASKVIGTGDTSGISSISRVDSIENSFSTRAEYRLRKNFFCALDYSFNDYNSRTSSLYEGTVQRIMASVRTTW